MIRFYLRLVYSVLLVCFLGTVWGGVYLSRQGFGQKWRKKLSEEFALRGVEVAARRLTLDPLRGLVARDLQIFHDHRRQEVAGTINELRLDINYARLLRGRPFLDALTLQDARFRIDLDSGRRKKKEIVVESLGAQIFFRSNQIEIKQLSGSVSGVEVDLSGVFLNQPTGVRGDSRRAPWQKGVRISDRAWRRWKEVSLAKSGGRLEGRFLSDPTQPRALQTAEVRLFLPGGEWRRTIWRDLRLEADFAKGIATIRRLEWNDGEGGASLSGLWQPGGEGRLAGQATINPTRWLQQTAFFPGIEIEGTTRWEGEFSWDENTKNSPRLIGKVEATQVRYRSISWDKVGGQFSWEKERYAVRKLELTQGSGTVTGEIWKENGRTSGELLSTINPRIIWQSWRETLPTLLRDAEFPGNPWWKLAWSGSVDHPGDWAVRGEWILGRTNFRGVTLTSSQATFEGTPNRLRLEALQITRPEGQLTGVGDWDGAAGRLTLRDVKSSLNLVAIGLWLDRSLAEAMETVRLPKGTVLTGEGWLEWQRGEWHRAEVQWISESVATREMPLLNGLVEEWPWLESPIRMQATVRMEKSRLTLDPLRLSLDTEEVLGTLTWDLAGKKILGTLSPSRGGKPLVNASSWTDVRWQPVD